MRELGRFAPVKDKGEDDPTTELTEDVLGVRVDAAGRAVVATGAGGDASTTDKPPGYLRSTGLDPGEEGQVAELGRTKFGYAGLDLSRDGSLVVTYDQAGSVKLWIWRLPTAGGSRRR